LALIAGLVIWIPFTGAWNRWVDVEGTDVDRSLGWFIGGGCNGGGGGGGDCERLVFVTVATLA
jgi:hypothetical protein